MSVVCAFLHLIFGSTDDVFEFLSAVSRTHDLQALVVMLCVLLACPLPSGVPLNILLEVMHHIYSPPPPPDEPSTVHHQSGDGASLSALNTDGPKSPSSPHMDAFSSPPLLKRSSRSPLVLVSATPILHNASLEDVARSLPFDREEKSSVAADNAGRSHRSVQFLITAACIKPVLAVTFVSATPSLSLAGTHVRQSSKTT
jgi:hypothetical protein